MVPRDGWIHVEFSVKMNSSPEKSDGEQNAAKHPDFLTNDRTAIVWFDDVMLAKNY